MLVYYHSSRQFQNFPPDGSSTVSNSFYEIWLRVVIPMMAWGFGTAIGELPPYFISRQARRSKGAKDEEFEKELADSAQATDPFSKMKMWTVNFTEK